MSRSQQVQPRPLRTQHSVTISSQSNQIQLPISTRTASTTSSHNKMPSITNTMHWLARSATPTSSSSSYTPSKPPVRISEPKLVRSLDQVAPRTGTLGAGATVVRTPDEALRETGVRLNYEDKQSLSASKASLDKKDKRDEPEVKVKKNKSPSPSVASTLVNEPISPPCSPPLPPLPLEDSEDSRRSRFEIPKSPPRPNRAPPPAPIPIPAIIPMQSSSSGSSGISRRSSLKVRSISTGSREEEAPVVPPLPAHIAASTQTPPFFAVLLSEPPSNMIDPSKLIVIVETCTQTYKTTFATITSRPSHLSEYIQSILGRPEYENSFNSMTASVYSTASDDMATYRHHLTSQGLVPSTASLHIFLDRASAPYAHILSYLRTPVISGQPETLPRALQIHATNSPSSKLESLIEARDEAAFLNLEGLYKLCTDEIRLRYGPRVHVRGNSTSAASLHSLHASVYSMQTLLEHGEVVDERNSISTPAAMSDPGILPKNHSRGVQSAKEQAPAPVGRDSRSRSPPTPQSWEGPGPALQQRSSSRQSQSRNSLKSLKATPGGWI